ncbi:MAG TPA: GNAT family N-acetyltransferase [Trebonia sp.]|jgi:GNAT superfamily N-acetyltransferase|nr:GNAT family N-acetyltransferase [Trebonia sp.]
MSARIITTSDRPDLDEQGRAALLADWPEFVLHDRWAPELMGRAWTCFPQYDVRLLEDDAVAAGGWAVPLRWDGAASTLPDGYDGALAQAVAGHEGGEPPDTLCVMAVAVRPDRQRMGLAGDVITALRERGERAGLGRVIVPVRPALKSRYPLASMEAFARWARADGRHLDAWIRTHQRLGASILAPAPRSMIVTGTVAQWEEWAAMAFPETGQYVVPGALDLVSIDRERDLGTYAETNLWMRHA